MPSHLSGLALNYAPTIRRGSVRVMISLMPV